MLYRLIFVSCLFMFNQCESSKQMVNSDDKEVIVIRDNTQVIPGEVIVELIKSAEVTTLTEDFNKYGVRVLNRLSPSMNLYLLYYDVSTIKSDKMLALLNKHELVKTTELNKKLSTRD